MKTSNSDVTLRGWRTALGTTATILHKSTNASFFVFVYFYTLRVRAATLLCVNMGKHSKDGKPVNRWSEQNAYETPNGEHYPYPPEVLFHSGLSLDYHEPVVHGTISHRNDWISSTVWSDYRYYLYCTTTVYCMRHCRSTTTLATRSCRWKTSGWRRPKSRGRPMRSRTAWRTR